MSTTQPIHGRRVCQTPVHSSRYHAYQATTSVSRQELIAAASRVAETLRSQAFEYGRYVCWADWEITQDTWRRRTNVGGDLYSGLPGIALFFAYLSVVTDQPELVTFSQRVLKSAKACIKRSLYGQGSIGVFNGLSGWIYVLCHCAVLWSDPSLIDDALEAVDVLLSKAHSCLWPGLLLGYSGCLAALLVLHQLCPAIRVERLIRVCADALVRDAITVRHGVAWKTPIRAKAPLTGAGHGNAGIAWPLLAAATVTQCPTYRNLGQRAIDYETSTFVGMEGNWPDFRFLLRHPDGRPVCGRESVFSALWCWGASGIGMMRLRCLPHVVSPQAIRLDIDAALETTMNYGFGRSHCLCHGDLGNADLFVLASEILDDGCWLREARRVASLTLSSFSREGFLCGNPHWVESPGLMTGLAGIGYGLLRVAQPETVPSLLALCAPIFR